MLRLENGENHRPEVGKVGAALGADGDKGLGGGEATDLRHRARHHVALVANHQHPRTARRRAATRSSRRGGCRSRCGSRRGADCAPMQRRALLVSHATGAISGGPGRCRVGLLAAQAPSAALLLRTRCLRRRRRRWQERSPGGLVSIISVCCCDVFDGRLVVGAALGVLLLELLRVPRHVRGKRRPLRSL